LTEFATHCSLLFAAFPTTQLTATSRHHRLFYWSGWTSRGWSLPYAPQPQLQLWSLSPYTKAGGGLVNILLYIVGQGANVHAVDGQWLNTVQSMPRKLVGSAVKPMKRAVQGFFTQGHSCDQRVYGSDPPPFEDLDGSRTLVQGINASYSH